jgi:hypothetical protein
MAITQTSGGNIRKLRTNYTDAGLLNETKLFVASARTTPWVRLIFLKAGNIRRKLNLSKSGAITPRDMLRSVTAAVRSMASRTRRSPVWTASCVWMYLRAFECSCVDRGLFLAYFPYFEKIKGVLWDHLAAYLCIRVCLSICCVPPPPLFLLGGLWDHLAVRVFPIIFCFLWGPCRIKEAYDINLLSVCSP